MDVLKINDDDVSKEKLAKEKNKLQTSKLRPKEFVKKGQVK